MHPGRVLTSAEMLTNQNEESQALSRIAESETTRAYFAPMRAVDGKELLTCKNFGLTKPAITDDDITGIRHSAPSSRYTATERKAMHSSKRRLKGFSLIELLVVVAIVLILAALAVPNLLRARRAANEASSVASLRAIASGQMAYQAYSGGLYYVGWFGI